MVTDEAACIVVGSLRLSLVLFHRLLRQNLNRSPESKDDRDDLHEMADCPLDVPSSSHVPYAYLRIPQYISMLTGWGSVHAAGYRQGI